MTTTARLAANAMAAGRDGTWVWRSPRLAPYLAACCACQVLTARPKLGCCRVCQTCSLCENTRLLPSPGELTAASGLESRDTALPLGQVRAAPCAALRAWVLLPQLRRGGEDRKIVLWQARDATQTPTPAGLPS